MNSKKTILESIVKHAVKEELNKHRTMLREADEATELEAAMGQSLQALQSEFKSKAKELQADVQGQQVEIAESLGVIAILGFILALPKFVEIIVRGLSKLISTFKKFFKRGGGGQDENTVATSIIHFTHKWHHAYIKALKVILSYSGVFSKAGIKDDATQQKLSEGVYYTIIAGLALYSGVGAVSAFKTALASAESAGNFSLAAFEGAMATIKTSEVSSFLTKLGLK